MESEHTSDTTSTRVIGRRLGEFTILGELGRGGMGVVYRARQESMGRVVALKTLPSFIGMDHDAVARFRREAEASGRLSHPGIVPIYAVGEAEGVHYYAMELVEGTALSDLIEVLEDRSPERLLGSITEEAAVADRETTVSGNFGAASMHMSGGGGAASAAGTQYAFSCAAIVADLTAALSAAHRGLVIHRDIKPSNVLLRTSGQPVLVDFGLARDEASVGLTNSGDALGTPAYMAPEQARGDKDLDARVDIYGVGALLYEMLTLRAPFDGAHPAEIMRKIVELDPVPVRQLNPRVPQDLETIVHTCLAKHPDDRYAAAEGLEMDLRDFLAGREIVARKPTWIERLTRVLKRDRRAAVAALVVLLVSGLAFTLMGVISRQQAIADGENALVTARDALLGGEFRPALAAYGHARALLGDERVDVARRRHLPQVFEVLYAEPNYGVLERFLNMWPLSDRDAMLVELRSRLRGRGELLVEADPAAVIEFRKADTAPDAWQQWEPGIPCGIGEYLVRVVRPGRAPTVQRAEVTRDEVTLVEPFVYPAESLRDGELLVVAEDGKRASLVQRTELSRRAYREMLEQIEDPALRAELTPREWSWLLEQGEDLPVVYTSFAQARAAAALLGGHLLSEDEYQLAASGGLGQLVYPWGDAFASEAVSADRLTMAGPAPVDHPRGVSPHGLLNIVGNVAEILSPGIDQWRSPLTAGGHYNSDAEHLRIDARKPLDRGIHDQRQWAGLRIARFVPQPPSEETLGAIQSLEKALFESGEWGISSDWRVRADGSAALAIRLVGRHSRERDTLVLPFATPGFEQISERVRAEDGHGRAVAVQHRPFDWRGRQDPSKQVGLIQIQLERRARAGQQFHYQVSTDLRARSAIHAEGDMYSFRVPLKVVSGVRSMSRVRLPKGSRVEAVDPAPTAQHEVDGAPELVWNHGASQGGGLELPAVVRFRCDGGLTERWPVRERVENNVRAFMDALADCDTKSLERLLDPGFAQRPHARGRERTIQAYSSKSERRDAFVDWHLLDATAVGDTVTAWVELDWQILRPNLAGQEERELLLRSWPMRLTMRREPTEADPGAVKILEFAPAGRADTGRIEGGTYWNESLRVRIEPPDDVMLRRVDGRLTDVQVVCVPSPLSSAPQALWSYSVFGLQGDVDDDQQDILHRLTDGAWSISEGRPIDGPEHSKFGEQGHTAKMLHWMIEPREGSAGTSVFVRESWSLMRLGQRWFLARARVSGASEREAHDTYREHRHLFDTLSQHVSIQDSGR